MPYIEEHHEFWGFPVVERRYEKERCDLREGATAHDEVEFFDNADTPSVEEALAERMELMNHLNYGYTGAEF